MDYHKPVLLTEVLDTLKVEQGGKYIDCTLGDGGHTLEILKLGGKVLGLDIERGSLERATRRISDSGFGSNFVGVLGNFKNLDNIAKANDFDRVNGIIFDLGYSSSQLEEDLGISFKKDQPLDMRIDADLGVTAADLVNSLPEKQLADIFFEYGGEKLARKFAKASVEHRNLKKFQTTADLANLISAEASPGYEHGRIHPATRVFQALRIAVNNELENLQEALPRAAHLLLPGGRMMVISFHSLEDRISKEFGRVARPTIKALTEKPVVASYSDVELNKRARSAKMRVFEKI